MKTHFDSTCRRSPLNASLIFGLLLGGTFSFVAACSSSDDTDPYDTPPYVDAEASDATQEQEATKQRDAISTDGPESGAADASVNDADDADAQVVTTGVVQLTTSGYHACARLASGSVACWGSDLYATLGDDGNPDDTSVQTLYTLAKPRAVTVVGIHDAVEVSAGGGEYGNVPRPCGYTCVRTTSGAVHCWGRFVRKDPNQALGDELVTDAVEISVGQRHACARQTGGSVLCWGWGVGTGVETATSISPTAVAGLPNDIVQIAAGRDYTCARRATGQVLCWGQTPTIGIGGIASVVPTVVDGVTDAVEIAVNRSPHTADTSYIGVNACARQSSGKVLCWGNNAAGQLGNGNVSAITTTEAPSPVANLTDAVQISVNGDMACARRASGQVVCWGSKQDYGLGIAYGHGSFSPEGPDGRSLIPVPAGIAAGDPEIQDAVEIAVGSQFVCMRRASGAVICWGANAYYGTLGTGDTTLDISTHALTDINAQGKPVVGLPDPQGGSYVQCDGVYTDTARMTNCGACGNTCLPNGSCDGTTCQCPSAQLACGGACIDPATDNSNCGLCGNICPINQVCQDKACTCPAGFALCNGFCTDLSQRQNCGQCGNHCTLDQVCQDGTCQ